MNVWKHARPLAPGGDVDAERIVDAARVEPGMIVADVSAGRTGLPLPLARRVGERGRVYALDRPERLAALADAAESGRWPQIVVRGTTERALPLPEGTLHAAFAVRALDAPHGAPALEDVHRALRPDGLLHVVDAHPEAAVTAFVERAGFRLLRRFEPGGSAFGFTFRRAG